MSQIVRKVFEENIYYYLRLLGDNMEEVQTILDVNLI